jgi:hypothetical protein
LNSFFHFLKEKSQETKERNSHPSLSLSRYHPRTTSNSFSIIQPIESGTLLVKSLDLVIIEQDKEVHLSLSALFRNPFQTHPNPSLHN